MMTLHFVTASIGFMAMESAPMPNQQHHHIEGNGRHLLYKTGNTYAVFNNCQSSDHRIISESP